jgi:hypothetical protein
LQCSFFLFFATFVPQIWLASSLVSSAAYFLFVGFLVLCGRGIVVVYKKNSRIKQLQGIMHAKLRQGAKMHSRPLMGYRGS